MKKNIEGKVFHLNTRLFLDTCSLLAQRKTIFKTKEKFYISNITLQELENIKTSAKKDEETKYAARDTLRQLKENKDLYNVVIYKTHFLEDYLPDFPDTPDNRIIVCAKVLQKEYKEDVLFCTEDLACEAIARHIYLPVLFRDTEKEDNYTGFKDISLTESELADFYNNIYANNINTYGLLENEYLIIRMNGQIVGRYVWRDNQYFEVQYQKAESKMFGKVTPYHGDVYQQLALESLGHNQLTLLRGPAGSGKSLLSFAYMFSLLEKGAIDRIVIFCNTVATRGAAKLGFYPGDRTSKLLDSQIGNFLVSKLGDRIEVEKLIENGQLVLLPMSDIRGYDTSGMNAAVYITEAQNLDIELMKLALQRIGDDAICILDGDDTCQVDLSLYAGDSNGMKRVSKVFRGHDFFGEVTLQNIHRSKIANLAQEL